MVSDTTPVNEVRLIGRVTGEPQERELPSGDVVVTLRVTVDRPRRRGDPPTGRRQVDAIDLACWSARTRAAGARAAVDDVVEVRGSLRRRFQQTGGPAVSRYEVEVSHLRRAQKGRL